MIVGHGRYNDSIHKKAITLRWLFSTSKQTTGALTLVACDGMQTAAVHESTGGWCSFAPATSGVTYRSSTTLPGTVVTLIVPATDAIATAAVAATATAAPAATAVVTAAKACIHV